MPCFCGDRRACSSRVSATADEFDLRVRGEHPGMMLAQMPDADDSDPQPPLLHLMFGSTFPEPFPAPAVLTFLLGSEEFEQALDLRGHVPVRFEDLGGVPHAHLGAEDQPVRLVQRTRCPRG